MGKVVVKVARKNLPMVRESCFVKESWFVAVAAKPGMKPMGSFAETTV